MRVRDMCDVPRLARLPGDQQVARDDDVFGERRTAGESEFARRLTLGHDAVALESGILAVRDEDALDVARCQRRCAQHARIGDAVAVVGKCHGTGVRERPEIARLHSGTAARDRGDRIDRARCV